MKKCPYCAEEIQDGAIKCKHCGEILDKSTNKSKDSAFDKGSTDARAVAKGLKQKELHDYGMGCFGLLALIASIAIGTWLNSFWVGLVIFIVCMVLIARWYYKE